jgi:hypothetical protein
MARVSFSLIRDDFDSLNTLLQGFPSAPLRLQSICSYVLAARNFSGNRSEHSPSTVPFPYHAILLQHFFYSFIYPIVI